MKLSKVGKTNMTIKQQFGKIMDNWLIILLVLLLLGALFIGNGVFNAVSRNSYGMAEQSLGYSKSADYDTGYGSGARYAGGVQ